MTSDDDDDGNDDYYGDDGNDDHYGDDGINWLVFMIERGVFTTRYECYLYLSFKLIS
jgi:hypothetical protein